MDDDPKAKRMNSMQPPGATRPAETQAGCYVRRGGTQYGPFALEALREHMRTGQLRADDQVWSPPHNAWLPAVELFAPEPPSQAKARPSSAAEPAQAKAAAEPAAGQPAQSPKREVPYLGRYTAYVYGAMISLLVLMSLAACLQFLDFGKGQPSTFDLDGEHNDALILAVQIVKVDLLHEQLRLQVKPTVAGKLAMGPVRLPARDIDLTVPGVGPPRTISFKRKRRMRPFVLDIPLSDGRIQLYPVDHYQATIEAEATSPASAPGEVAERVPIVIELKQRDHSVQITPQLLPKTEGGETVLKLDVGRPFPIVVFTWFMVGVAAFLGLTVVLVVTSVITGRRKPELGMLGWMSALLFALPAVRNSLPGAPPLGALIDYTAFFWAEALVGLSTMMVVALWFTHRETDGSS